jgi:hypothetical protein
MTQDEIIEMARQSDLGFLLGDNWMMHHEFEAFAKLVAAHEREACAKLCAEDSVQAMDFTGGTFVGGYFAQKIIKRGEE